MHITHEEARKLIQRNADEALHVQEKMTLSVHLKSCVECRAYAEEIKELESVLVPLMKRQWNLQPIPHSIAAIRAKANVRIQTNIILATRTAAISVVLLAFIFSAWQFAISGRQASTQLPVGVPPVPTPSTQSTSTLLLSQSCDEMLYVVQESDTLESISQQFAVSKEEIMAINRMQTETVHPDMELMISVCNFTPTSTIHPTIFSTRYTPSRHPTTSTPGG